MSRNRTLRASSDFSDAMSITSSSISALSRQESLPSFSSSRLLPPNASFGQFAGFDRSAGMQMINTNLAEEPSQLQRPPSSSSKASRKGGSVAQQLPSFKSGRVKVGIRCRPAFQDEIDFAQGSYMSIVDTRAEKPDQNTLGQVSLTLMSGKLREFQYDYVFGARDSQDSVYDRIARPVVTDVLKGFNGTIFAYVSCELYQHHHSVSYLCSQGQTGTGKTYTMGILECVNSDHAGIIPRAISQIFDHIENQPMTNEISISLSFLQLYRETIQDLLAPASGSNVWDDNLAIREDPARGFYVEGLQEFVVRSYEEAEALLNLGLENRAIAPTLMNSTSSRSHTVLTMNIEQRGTSTNSNEPGKSSSTVYSRTIRSKLLMVDLAGSERVRRTVSKGTRLSEAKSINTSLSALGNVIAALADPHTAHIPYRDSKLTRLLQDSLGGTASTALIATVGPAAINYGETLSTLLFATRCMAVKTTPIQHEEVDYADLCTRLQGKLSVIEAEHAEAMLKQQEKYESMIRDLNAQLTTARGQGYVTHEHDFGSASSSSKAFGDSPGYNSLIKQMTAIRSSNSDAGGVLGTWLGRDSTGMPTGDDELLALLGFCYEVLVTIVSDSVITLEANRDRELEYKRDLVAQFAEETHLESAKEKEIDGLEAEDPMLKNNVIKKVGSHLAPLTRLEALNRVEGHYRSNNEPVSPWDRAVLDINTGSFKENIASFNGPQELAETLAAMQSIIQVLHC
jgi:hypothetical protein